MHRLGSLLLVSVIPIPLVVACGGSDQEISGPAETVTVSAPPADVASAPNSTDSGEIPGSTAIPGPEASDFRAAAIFALQDGISIFRGASDENVKNFLELTCSGLLAIDGKRVGNQGFEFAEVVLESAGINKPDYPVVIRAATAFCPQALPEVAERYGS